MELEVLSASCPSVIWRTKLPGFQGSYKSPFFAIGGCVQQFKLYGFENSDDGRCVSWDLKIAKTVEAPAPTRAISVYIQNESGQLKRIYSGVVTLYPNVDTYICKLTKLNIKKLGVMNYTRISLVFVFDVDSRQRANALESLPLKRQKIEIRERLPEEDSCLLSLSKDIEKLFDKEEQSDAVLCCLDCKFFVNRKILSARSDVFAAMFRSKMSESESGVINIDDFEPSIFERFLRFVYSCRIENLDMNSAYELYRAADKYAVESLKRRCVSYMVLQVSESNVCQVLPFAAMFKDSVLLGAATSFAAIREEFLSSPAWNDFADAHPTLGVRVFKNFHAIR